MNKPLQDFLTPLAGNTRHRAGELSSNSRKTPPNLWIFSGVAIALSTLMEIGTEKTGSPRAGYEL